MFKLPETEQEVFDIVCRHLITQNQKSQLSNGDCVYRNPQGLKCAAGVLIPDQCYDKHFERNSWIDLCEDELVPNNHRQLIHLLQCVHDDWSTENWENQLRNIANNFKLNTTVLDELCTT